MSHHINVFPFSATDTTEHVVMPPDAVILGVIERGGPSPSMPALVVACDDQGSYTGRRIAALATGDEVPTAARYIGTITIFGAVSPPDMLHIFDLGESDPRSRAAQFGLAALGHNDPCPCGSGRKFKRCHGA